MIVQLMATYIAKLGDKFYAGEILDAPGIWLTDLLIPTGARFASKDGTTERVTEIFKYILRVSYDTSKIALPASSGQCPKVTLPLRHKNIIGISCIWMGGHSPLDTGKKTNNNGQLRRGIKPWG